MHDGRKTSWRVYLWLLGAVIVAVSAGALFFALFNTAINNQLDAIATPTPLNDGVRVVAPPKPVLDFTLTSHTGQPVSLSDLRGKPVLLFFGYTHCPDVCPLTMLAFRRVHEALGEQADDIAYVFISVDPQRDTPEQLARYLEQRNVPFVIGLQGDDATLQRIARDYNLVYEQVPDPNVPSNYLMNHTSNAFLFNAEGRMTAIFAFQTDAEVIAEHIRPLLPPS